MSKNELASSRFYTLRVGISFGFFTFVAAFVINAITIVSFGLLAEFSPRGFFLGYLFSQVFFIPATALISALLTTIILMMRKTHWSRIIDNIVYSFIVVWMMSIYFFGLVSLAAFFIK